MSPRRATAVLGTGALAAALAGCGLGAGRAPTAVQLLVTRDFGAVVLQQTATPRQRGEDTVMSLLMRNASVTTRYAGGFVQSIGGLAGGREAGSPVDWFFYVNGVESNKGAAEIKVHPGDRIWWDRHDWGRTEDVPAVVGSYPEPFLNGVDGKRLPVRIECEAVASPACRTVAAAMHQAGVPAAIAAPGANPGTQTLRVLVGTWGRIATDPAASPIAKGPSASGVYARFGAGGRALALLGATGATTRTLEGSAGLVAATRHGEDAPAWLVTGTDRAGVELAARALDAATLERRFAVAVAPAGSIPLPAAAAAGITTGSGATTGAGAGAGDASRPSARAEVGAR